MRSKKGISPLIGTVLLVAITIAMVLMIMPWITKTIKSQQEKTTEAARGFDCMTALDFELSKDTIGYLKLDNRGTTAIKSLTYRTTTLSTGSVSAPSTTAIVIQPLNMATTSILCSVGNSVEVMATITSEGKDMLCSDMPKTYTC